MCHHRSCEIEMSRETRNPRRGVAAVEFALLLPVFVLLVLGTIEATSMIFLQQSLEIAAYEGARIGLVPGSTAGNVEGAVLQILDARNVQGSTTTVRNVRVGRRRQRGEPRIAREMAIQVTVEVACNENSLFSPWFYAGQTMSADVALKRERIQ